MSRLSVRKTYKLFIGGAFPRSESGRVSSIKNSKHHLLAYVSKASRKDLREAVVAAAKAQPAWAKKSGYNRGQILYRFAEILEQRSADIVSEMRKTDERSKAAKKEVLTTIDHLIWYAGWADKLFHIFGSVNPVASSHFSFSVPEPMGVVGIVAPNNSSLLSLVTLIASGIISGNSVVVLASEKHPFTAVTLAEILATSDIPAGVVNILTGSKSELVSFLANHLEVNAIVDASGDETLQRRIESDAATHVQRVASRKMKTSDWYGDAAKNPLWILDTMEIKTTWHPIGI